MSRKSTINILAGCMILLSVMVPLIQFFRLYLHERYFSGSTWFVILSVLCMILAVLLFAKKSGWVFVILVLLICAYDTCEGIRVFKLDGMKHKYVKTTIILFLFSLCSQTCNIQSD